MEEEETYVWKRERERGGEREERERKRGDTEGERGR